MGGTDRPEDWPPSQTAPASDRGPEARNYPTIGVGPRLKKKKKGPGPRKKGGRKELKEESSEQVFARRLAFLNFFEKRGEGRRRAPLRAWQIVASWKVHLQL